MKFPFRIGVLMRFKNFACRDRRPRRSENERILNLHPAIICSHIKSKICCFPDRRKAIAAGPYKVLGKSNESA